MAFYASPVWQKGSKEQVKRKSRRKWRVASINASVRGAKHGWFMAKRTMGTCHGGGRVNDSRVNPYQSVLRSE